MIRAISRRRRQPARTAPPLIEFQESSRTEKDECAQAIILSADTEAVITGGNKTAGITGIQELS